MTCVVWMTEFRTTTIKFLNLIIRDAKNNGRAALNEKAPIDQHNDEDNVNASKKV